MIRLLLLAVVALAGSAAADMTDGAVPAEKIKPLMPKKLAGYEPSHVLDYPWSYAAAYTVDGGYANLDIHNTFHRATKDTRIEDDNASNKRLCPKKERVTGFTACVSVEDGGRTAIRWYLADRLTVRIAAPTEKLARKMAAELPIAKLAKLSAAK
jgi:hypothetical protein